MNFHLVKKEPTLNENMRCNQFTEKQKTYILGGVSMDIKWSITTKAKNNSKIKRNCRKT